MPLVVSLSVSLLVLLAVVFFTLAFSRGIGQRAPSLESRLTAFNRGVGAAVTEDLSRPFFERTVAPLISGFGRWVGRRTPSSIVASTEKRLITAGLRSTNAFWAFLAAKGVCLVTVPSLAFLVAWWWLGRLPVHPLLLLLGLGFVYLGWRLPDFWLDGRIGSRKKRIVRGLPDAIDLLTVSIEAGTAIEAALSNVGEKFSGPLSEEFSLAVYEMSLGKRRRQALQDMADRVDVPELSSFVGAIVRADQSGGDVGDVLRVQADGLRVRRRQRAQEQAQQAPVKMLFPLILGIFPAMFVVILAPALIRALGILREAS